MGLSPVSVGVVLGTTALVGLAPVPVGIEPGRIGAAELCPVPIGIATGIGFSSAVAGFGPTFDIVPSVVAS